MATNNLAPSDTTTDAQPGAGDTNSSDTGGDAPSTAPEAPPTTDEPTEPALQHSRDAVTFDADNYISKFTMSITSNDINRVYDLTSTQHIDTEKDFPGGISRAATYVGNMTIDIKSMAEAQGKYPLVSSDKVQIPFPQLLRDNSTFKGRLRDATADWDRTHEGVGNYEIKDGKLTFNYDDGYLAEKSGKVTHSSVQFSGGFDFSSYTESSFRTELIFGSIRMNTHWSAMEIVRNLSIEKTGDCYGDENHSKGEYFKSGTSYPLNRSAYVERGYIFYTLKLTAGEDNTHALKNVKVTDVFTDGSDKKVDLSTMILLSASIDGEDILSKCTPLTDDAGNVNGWNIGSLPPAQVATIRFKIKLNPDGITAAVDADKDKDPASDALEGRTIKNTATASADSVPPVTAQYQTYVQNLVMVNKSAYPSKNTFYDYKTQTIRYKIEFYFPASNRHTVHNVPIYDCNDAYGSFSNGDIESTGIKSISVTHSDGTTKDVTWENFKSITNDKWCATLPEAKPGDKFSIYSYAQLSNGYFNRREGGIAGSIHSFYNYVYSYNNSLIDLGIYANDLNRTSGSSILRVNKKVLDKYYSSMSNGYVIWTILGNERAKTATPLNVGGQTFTDVLGPNQEFEDENVKVVFYSAEDGKKVGEDSIQLHKGDTSFTYTIPEQYGTCEFRLSYRSKITDWDTYVGAAKQYSNVVKGLGDWETTGYTTHRYRVPAMSKSLVTQEGNWAQWRTAIYSDVQNGDVYTDTSRGGIGYMYFTQEQLNDIELQFNGAPVDRSLYTIAPVGEGTDGKYASWTITFNGQITSQKDGKTITPSKTTPLIFTYKSTIVNPDKHRDRNYYNDAQLKSGTSVDKEYSYCYRNNYEDLSKTVARSSNGIVIWQIKTNKYDGIAQVDGTCIVTDTLPAGLEFVKAYKDEGTGDVEYVSQHKNDDGTTDVTLKLTGLYVSQNVRGYWTYLDFYILTKIVDPEYLYGTESKDFNYDNKVSLTDRFGEYHSYTASTYVHHTAIKKSMEYTEQTAPFAKFSIELNKEKVDLNPDGDMVNVVDVSTDTLSVDPDSFEVINATTGDPVEFKIDASEMSKNKVTISVPDDLYIKVTYLAQIKGKVGKTVTVGNSAFFEGYDSHHEENTINTPLVVLKAAGQAVSEPMVWLAKRNESAHALAGATFELNMYEPGEGWKVIRDDIKSTGDNNSKGTKIESLETGKLYRLVETDAPDGYVLDGKPYYFALTDENTEDVTLPEDVKESEVLQGPAGTQITVYNAPYTKVKLHKASYDNVALQGAQFEVYNTETNKLALDDKGNAARVTTDADGNGYLTLAPGTYRLHEVAAPTGYEVAQDVVFSVTGDAKRTITQANKPVGEVTVVDASQKTSLVVSKTWKDANNRDGARPASVQMQLMLNGKAVEGARINLTKEGPDGVAGTQDDWTASFDNLNVMVGGKKATYTAREVDVAANYTDTYTDTQGEGKAASTTVVTNTRTFAPVSVSVQKVWDDAQDANTLRPSSITVHLLADGKDTGRSTSVTVAGPDQILGTPDDWSATFDNLDAVVNDTEITYSVAEDAVPGYAQLGNPTNLAAGYSYRITNQLKPMVWLQKQDETGAALPGATFELAAYTEGTGWTTVAQDLTSTDATRGIRLSSLESNKLYRLTETAAPNMYVLDATPYFFVLNQSEGSAVPAPADLAPETINQLKTGDTISRTNAPYTEVTLEKKSYDGVALAGVKLAILNSDGTQAVDNNGTDAVVITDKDGSAKVILAPGTYKLHEVEAPEGYELAADVSFTVVGNTSRDVTVDGQVVAAVTMVDNSQKTTLPVSKIWKDANNRDGTRPDSVTMQLTVDGVPEPDALLTLTKEGPDAKLGTEDDWTGTFTNLNVMRGGTKAVYGAIEVDVPEGYTATYEATEQTEDSPASVVVTNTRTFAHTSIAVHKTWDDANNKDGLRPSTLVVHLLANGADTGKTATLSQQGPDGQVGTADDWSAIFDELDAVADDAEVSYTVSEDMPEGYTQAEEPKEVDPATFGLSADKGFELVNHHTPEPEPDMPETKPEESKPEAKPEPEPTQPEGRKPEAKPEPSPTQKDEPKQESKLKPDAQTKSQPAKRVTPKTGDVTNPLGGALVALIGAGFIAAGTYRRKKDKRD